MPSEPSSAELLRSYVTGTWVAGTGIPVELVNPSTGEVLRSVNATGVDVGGALEFARKHGGPALRHLSYGGRADLLKKIADLLGQQRTRWADIARLNSGNTQADAAIDIDGAIGTLKYFARLGNELGDARILADAAAIRVTRDPNFQAIHLGVPLEGVAVHINAFNFPAWGLWEKAAVSLLSGVPVLAKPATATAWLAHDMVAAIVDAGILPDGSLSLLTGAPGDLLDHLRDGDVVAFTGSRDTADHLRSHAAFTKRGVRLNVEADSLNAAILGPSASPETPDFHSFCREIVREMTSKAGQKCTAIRRALVPQGLEAAVCDALADALGRVVVGDPVDPSVTMGPLVAHAQRNSVEDGIRALSSGAQVVFGQQLTCARRRASPPRRLRGPDVVQGACDISRAA